MEITPELQSLIDRIPAAQPPLAPASNGSLLGRLGKSVVNLPSNIGEGVVQTGLNLLEWGNPEGPQTKVDVPNFFDIPKAQTFGEGAIDMIAGKGGIADIVGQSLVPAGIIGKIGKAAGIAEGPSLEAAKWAAGFAGPEIQREEATGADVAVAAGTGVASGGMSFLPRRLRVIPNLISSTLHGGYEAAVRGPEAGLIAFGADMIGGQLPAAMKREGGVIAKAADASDGHKPMVPTGPIESTPLPTPEPPPIRSALEAAQTREAVPQGQFATLQSLEQARFGGEGVPLPKQAIQMPWEMQQRAPADIITGVKPRPDVQIIGEPRAPSGSIVPVEQPRNIKVSREAPAAQMVAHEPKIPKTSAERGYGQDLIKRYAGMAEHELRAIKADLDFEIANTLDDETKQAYDNARSAVDTVLEARGQTSSPVPELSGMPASQPAFEFKERVVHKDVFGQEQHGTVIGTVGGRVKVKFDGEAEATLISANTLGKSDRPRDIATLQNAPDPESLEAKEFAEGLAREAQTAPISEIDREASKTGKKPRILGQASVEMAGTSNLTAGVEKNINDALMMNGGDKAKSIQFLEKYAEVSHARGNAEAGGNFQAAADALRSRASVGTGPELKLNTHVDTATKTIIDRIVTAYKTATNKNLHFKFVTDAELAGSFSKEKAGIVMARATEHSEIELNAEWTADLFSNWHKKTPTQQKIAFAKFSRVLGHESGHIALQLAAAEDPKIIRRLVDEFKALNPETRHNIISDYYASVGIKMNDEAMSYHAGNAAAISKVYNLHKWNVDAQDFLGMQEFFADMTSAHLFGKLKEELLPKEISSFWNKIKDVFSGLVNKLRTVSFGGDFSDVEQQVAFRNFHEIVQTVSDAMPAHTPAAWDDLATTARRHIHNAEYNIRRTDATARNLEGQFDQGYLTTYDLPELRKLHGNESWFNEMERNIRDRDSKELATLQNEHSKNDNKWPKDFQYLSRASVDMAPSPIMGNNAFIQSTLLRELGAAAIGMAVGGVVAPRLTDQQMTIAEGMIAGGILGVAGPIVLRRMIGMMPKPGATSKLHIPPKEAFIKLFTGPEGWKELGGDAANGQGSASAKLIRFMERNLNLNLPEEAFNALVTAEGPAAYAVQIASDAFAKARNFVTNSQIDTAVSDYLRGEISTIDLRRHLGSNVEAQEFGNFIITGRESIGQLQQMFISGLAEGPFKQKIVSSFDKGDYLTRMYRIFHDPDYKPTQDQIEEVALKLQVKNPDYDISTARAVVEDYLHQIETERAMYRGSVSDVGQKLDAAIFSRRNDELDIAFRDMLGEFVNPKEQIMGTIRHLYTNAVASKFYDNVANLTDKLGLKMAYGRDEVSRIKEQLQVAVRKAKVDGKDFATLQKQLTTLENYVPLDPSVRYGKLKGQMVSRFIRDQLASFDSPWGILDGSIMRSMAKFHNHIKIGRTALNPITVIRNIVSAPILMAMAKANPGTLPRALRAIRDRTSADFREMLEQGIYGVDQVRGEFLRNAEQIMMGDFDHTTIEGMFKSGLNRVLEFYRAPDMLVRGTTYLTAKRRIARKLNLPETDQRVINEARDWTNRYTVNYANVAPLIKTLRQVPFTNLFISYTAEVTRIAKNLIADVFQHSDTGQRIHAAGVLGGLVALPVLFEKGSVDALSPKDKEEWERAEKQMPDYARTRFKVVMSKEGHRFKYLDITPILQIDPLMQMFRAASNQDWKAFAAVNPVFGWENTPLMNVVAEQITGKDLRRDRPIDQSVFTRAQAVMKEVIPPIFPGGYEYGRVTDAFTRNEHGEFGISNLRTGKRTTPGEIVQSYLTGMKLTTVDSSNLGRFAISDAKRRIANEASYYRDIANTDLPLPAKQRAAERYRKSVQGILLDLQASLGTPSQ